MIGLRTTFKPANMMVRLQQRVERAKVRGLSRAAGAIRLTARRSIRERKKASAPGKPPHTHDMRVLKESRIYNVDYMIPNAIIGPGYLRMRDIAAVHEFGGKRVVKGKSRRYLKRPFMGPALDINLHKIPKAFEGTLF